MGSGVCEGRGRKETDETRHKKVMRERRFHVLPTLKSLKWYIRPAGPSQIIDFLVQDTFSNPRIN